MKEKIYKFFFPEKYQFQQQIKGAFDNWEADRYYLYNERSKYWMCNGYSFFEEYKDGMGLFHLKSWQRKLVWEEANKVYKLKSKLFQETKVKEYLLNLKEKI